MPGQDEQEFLSKLKEGDERGFHSLIGIYLKKSYGLAFRMMGNDSDAREMIQETCIKVYRKLDLFDFNSPFGPWFFRILINTCINNLKRKKLRRFFSLSDSENIEKEKIDRYSGDFQEPDKEVLDNERAEYIQRALEKIPEKQRAALILFDIEGFSQQETAEILKCPTGSVMSRVYYGRKRLRKLLEVYFQDEK